MNMFSYKDVLYGNVFSDIQKYRNLIEEQREEIKNKEIIINSLTDSMVKKVKSIIIPYLENMLNEAWSQQSKPKKEQSMLKFIKNDIFERLLEKNEVKEAKFKAIVPEGYERHAFQFTFDYKGFQFKLKIPNVKVADNKNLEYMYYGKYVLFFEKRNGVWEVIESSYNLDDLKLALHEFIDKNK